MTDTVSHLASHSRSVTVFSFCTVSLQSLDNTPAKSFLSIIIIINSALLIWRASRFSMISYETIKCNFFGAPCVNYFSIRCNAHLVCTTCEPLDAEIIAAKEQNSTHFPIPYWSYSVQQNSRYYNPGWLRRAGSQDTFLPCGDFRFLSQTMWSQSTKRYRRTDVMLIAQELLQCS